MFINKIGIVLKQASQQAIECARHLEALCHERGIATTRSELDDTVEMLVVLGGDGTLLHAAARAYEFDIPILGINLGALGFLTEFAADELNAVVDMLSSGGFELEERMLLNVTLCPLGGTSIHFVALNEAVITKGSTGKIIEIPVWTDDAFLASYRGDGLIVATPTGSTAYSLSAGGPLLHPTLKAIVVTPICPFALGIRPVILPAGMTIRMDVRKWNEEITLIIDGQNHQELQKGGQVLIRRAERTLKLVRSPSRDYFQILRGKLGWGKGIATPAKITDSPF
ncbi:MAG: NAD(+)/NADH kinase [Dissulfuribacterales bacterium]